MLQIGELGPGEEAEIVCPVHCAEDSLISKNDFSVWGGDGGVYSPLSFLCMAGLHSSGKNGGYFKVKILKGKEAYTGSESNNVAAKGTGGAKRSFSIDAITDRQDQIMMSSTDDLESPIEGLEDEGVNRGGQ
jgi:hypothetical protein